MDEDFNLFDEFIQGFPEREPAPEPTPAPAAEGGGEPADETARLKAELAETQRKLADFNALAPLADEFRKNPQMRGDLRARALGNPADPAPPASSEPARPAAAPAFNPQNPLNFNEAQLQELDQQALMHPGRTQLALAQAIAEKIVEQRLGSSLAPLHEATTASAIDSFVSQRAATDPLYAQINPYFRRAMEDPGVRQTLAKAPPSQRAQMIEAVWQNQFYTAYQDAIRRGEERGVIKRNVPVPSYNAGIQAVRSGAQTPANTLSEVDQLAVDMLINQRGMSREDAIKYISDGS